MAIPIIFDAIAVIGILAYLVIALARPERL
jgi:hypothetical protein